MASVCYKELARYRLGKAVNIFPLCALFTHNIEQGKLEERAASRANSI
jgi:hypothetical protein